ncbi:cobyrinic acid a,c-diamide synthase [Pseudomonas aeruginosa]|nr:cobyrinic acid a,c-diamide synthase [Pseudomonas aeruginosa]
MLYLLDCLEDADGERGELLGLLPGRARLQKRLTALALQEVELPEGRLRGHTFHHSTLDCAVEPWPVASARTAGARRRRCTAWAG